MLQEFRGLKHSLKYTQYGPQVYSKSRSRPTHCEAQKLGALEFK